MMTRTISNIRHSAQVDSRSNATLTTGLTKENPLGSNAYSSAISFSFLSLWFPKLVTRSSGTSLSIDDKDEEKPRPTKLPIKK